MCCDWLAEAGINKLRGKLSWRVGVPPAAVPSLPRVYGSIPTWVCLIRVAFHCASAVSCSFRLALNHNARRSACGGRCCALWGDFSWGSRGSASTSRHSLFSPHLDVLSLSNSMDPLSQTLQLVSCIAVHSSVILYLTLSPSRHYPSQQLTLSQWTPCATTDSIIGELFPHYPSLVSPCLLSPPL